MSDPHNKAPSYNDLILPVSDLREKVQALELETLEKPVQRPPSVEALNYRLLPDLDRSVSTFTGHEDSHVALDWIRTIEGLANLNNWIFEYQLQYVLLHLSDAARSWFWTEDFSDWADFVVKFRKTFVREIKQADKWREIDQRTQRADEHISDYFFNKFRMCKALGLSFVDTRDHVIEGLFCQELSVYALGRPHVSPTDLLADLKDWERMRALRKERFGTINETVSAPRPCKRKPVPSTPLNNWESFDAPVVISKSRNATTNPPRTPKPATGRSTIYCYNCRDPGHISKDCPKPRRPIKCTSCNSDQHTQSRCPVDATTRSQVAHAAEALRTRRVRECKIEKSVCQTSARE